MSKRTIGIFFIISVIMDVVGVIMIFGGLIGSTTDTSTQTAQLGNAPLFGFGILLAALSAIPFLIAWIGALINLGRLQEWVWFILMIIFSWITLLVYLIAGPTTRRAPQYAPYMPPQQAQNYPQQPYPQQPQNYAQPPQYNPEQQQNYPQPPQYNPQQQQSYPQQDYMQPPQNNPQPPENNPQS